MEYLFKELKLEGKVLSIVLTNDEATPERPRDAECTLSLLKRALSGETLCFDGKRMSCPGAVRGMGFSDSPPQIKGGFGNFISNGTAKAKGSSMTITGVSEEIMKVRVDYSMN